MHEPCVCIEGEPRYHESYVFSVGETATKTVELAIYQVNGRLSIISVSGYTSWKRSRDSGRVTRTKPIRKFNRTAMIDRVFRQEHFFTIDCRDLAFLFFGRNIAYTVRDVAIVEAPKVFGDAPGIEHRNRYMSYFTRRHESSTE